MTVAPPHHPPSHFPVHFAVIFLAAQFGSLRAADSPIAIWHGERQRVGHRGDAQDDFNVVGHIAPWRELDTLTWSLNGRGRVPLSFRAFRRLAEDGDFNADVPIAALQSGDNRVTIAARFRDGSTARQDLILAKETGACPLPLRIDWAAVRDPQDAGQYVDGHWAIVAGRLRTRQVGYDRLFLLGERTWRDYEVRTDFIVHSLAPETGPHSGGHGVGLILRFAGHITGGHRHFASGQPKWGYQPFGAISFIRWRKEDPSALPALTFYPGDSDLARPHDPLALAPGVAHGLRFRCTTLPDAPTGEGVTRYECRVWRADAREPAAWSWTEVQTSRHARRTGGVALLAHHVDASFGPVTVTPRAEGP